MFADIVHATAVAPEDQPQAARDTDWWRGAVVYQVYPRSFQDSNGDGIGDLNGVTERLDYIAGLGADAIWLSPFFTSPMDDFGYDVSDYRDVDPMFGTLADFDRMLDEAHARGLKIIIDLVLSHTSDRHPWFVESRSSRDNPKADWYVWAESKPEGSPPNNWLSIFGGPAWEWDGVRGQYYMHNFLKSQPDLNFHNMDVQNALLEVAEFWLERGVDGFRLDTVNFYVHDKELRDNPPVDPDTATTITSKVNPYSFQNHLYDKSRPENLQFLERLRTVMDRYPGSTSVGEIGDDGKAAELTASYTEGGKRIHMAYSFGLLAEMGSAEYIRATVEAMEETIGSGWPSWALSNHDVARLVSRWGRDDVADRFAPLAVALVTCLKGTPCVYQGEELGLGEADVPFEDLQDPYGIRFWPKYKGRDGSRTPMPWVSDNQNAGFTTADKPWLPVDPAHRAKSVDHQSGERNSALNRTQAFLAWRKDKMALKRGNIAFIDSPCDTLVFTRTYNGETLLCAFNLANEPVEITLSGMDLYPLDAAGFTGIASGTLLTLQGLDAVFARVL